MDRALTERADHLRAHGEPFVTATVVRVERPTSARTGNVALVHRDGTIEGFVGGVCAQHSVRLYSLKVIETGEPVLLRILPEGSAGVDDEHQATSVAAAGDADLALAGHEISHEQGTVTVRNPCLSGGALELFLEPSLPMPRVLVVGDSPIVRALKAIGPEVGLDVLATADEAEGELAPRAGDLALIVAAHGRGEVDALRAGLAAGIPYVGLVASVKRGAAVLADLRAEGVSQEQVSRVDSPAGLDIGARTAAEIALSILAEVIAVRRRDSDHVSEGTAGAETLSVIGPSGGSARSRVDPSDVRDAPSEGTEGPLIAVDPICGMTVVVVPGTPSSETEDGTAYFCCDGCRLTFERQRQTA